MSEEIKVNENNNVLEIKTVQVVPFRTSIISLKDILIEANIVFSRDGIKIVNMDKSHTVLAHLELHADKFEEYFISTDKIIIGVTMVCLFKIINIMGNDDTLTLYIDKDDYNGGIVSLLKFKYENGYIKQCNIHELKLIEPESEEIELPQVVYHSIITMPSTDFQKIIRDMSSISDVLEIKSVGNELIFKCKGGFANSELRRTESDDHMEFVHKQDDDVVTQGEYSLKNLGYFIKCTGLCSQIELYLENNLPLVIKYDVSSLGEIKLYLSSITS